MVWRIKKKSKDSDVECLDDSTNLVRPIVAEGHQETDSNFLRQSDRNFFVNVPGIDSDIDGRSHHFAVLYLPTSEFPVNMDGLALTLA